MTNPANSPYAAARKAVFDIFDALSAEQRRSLMQELKIKVDIETLAREVAP